MFVYVDESGCPGMKLTGGSFPQFTLAALVFRDQEATRRARLAIQSLRSQLGCRPDFEFRLNKSSQARAVAFFDAISHAEFTYHAFTLNKAALVAGALSESKKLYRSVVGWTFENIMERLAGPNGPDRASIMFDACGNRDFYDEFERRISAIARLKLKRAVPVRVLGLDSKADDLLQMADMVCGAVGRMRSGRRDAAQLLARIAAKCGSSRCWP